MRTLYQTLRAATHLKSSPDLHRASLDLDDQLDLQCRRCLMVVAPLSSVDYYMRIGKNQEKLGTHFLVLRQMVYHNLFTAAEPSLSEEAPFQCMYMQEVRCGKCGNSLGNHFLTANMEGTGWLLSKTALNIEHMALMSAQRNLMGPLLEQLQKLTPNEPNQQDKLKEVYMAEERLLCALLKGAVDPSYPENRAKHCLVEEFIAGIGELDKTLELLDRRGNTVAESAERFLYLYMKLFPQLKKQARERGLIKRP